MCCCDIMHHVISSIELRSLSWPSSVSRLPLSALMTTVCEFPRCQVNQAFLPVVRQDQTPFLALALRFRMKSLECTFPTSDSAFQKSTPQSHEKRYQRRSAFATTPDQRDKRHRLQRDAKGPRVYLHANGRRALLSVLAFPPLNPFFVLISLRSLIQQAYHLQCRTTSKRSRKSISVSVPVSPIALKIQQRAS